MAEDFDEDVVDSLNLNMANCWVKIENISCEGNGHGIALHLPLPTDVIAQGDKGGIEGGDGGGVSEGGVSEDLVVEMLDEDDYCVNSPDQNGYGLPTAPPREYLISFDRNEGEGFNNGCNRDVGVEFSDCIIMKLDRYT